AEIGVVLLAKPFSAATVRGFCAEALWCERASIQQRVVEALQQVRSLTPREVEVLSHHLAGHGRQEAEARLGMRLKTYDAHVRNVLQKIGDESMHALTHRLLRQSLDLALRAARSRRSQ